MALVLLKQIVPSGFEGDALTLGPGIALSDSCMREPERQQILEQREVPLIAHDLQVRLDRGPGISHVGDMLPDSDRSAVTDARAAPLEVTEQHVVEPARINM